MSCHIYIFTTMKLLEGPWILFNPLQWKRWKNISYVDAHTPPTPPYRCLCIILPFPEPIPMQCVNNYTEITTI